MENINELPKYEGAENLREGVDFIDVSEKSEKKLFKNKVEVLMSKLKSAKEKALKYSPLLVLGVTSLVLSKSLKESLEEPSYQEKLKDYISYYQNNEDYKEVRDYVVETIGEENTYNIESFSFINNEFYEEGNNEKNVVIRSEIVGDDFNKMIDDVFEPSSDMLPENITNEIAFIQFVDVEKKIPEKYGHKLQGNDVGGSSYVYHVEINKNDLKDGDAQSYASSFGTIFHEISHCNDWYKDQEMNPKERLDLVKSIIERLKSDDRFMSDYVENIENNNPYEEMDIKTQEYFAEIGEAYFMSPKELKESHPKDFEIIDSIVKKHDSDFDVFDFNEKLLEKVSDRSGDEVEFVGFNQGFTISSEKDYSTDFVQYVDKTEVEKEEKTEDKKKTNNDRLRELESFKTFAFGESV
jgi:hypothetical protein